MNLITEDYVSFEVAKLLKEKGFDEPTWTHYEDENEIIFGDEYDWNNSPMGQISAPTHQMAMKWLRSKGIVIVIKFEAGEVGIDNIELNLDRFYWVIYPFYLGSNVYTTYEKASEEAIKYALTHKPFES